MDRRKLPITRLVADVKDGSSNWDLMQKYELSYGQLVLVFAALVDKKLLKASHITDSVEALVEVGNLDYAKSIHERIQQKYPGIRGLKALGERLQAAEHYKKFRAEYNQFLAKSSPALDWLRTNHPSITLHPEVRRQIKYYELFLDKMRKDYAGINDDLVAMSTRLRLIVQNTSRFQGLNRLQTNRMWHYLALQEFNRRGVTQFHTISLDDVENCGVCMRLSYQGLEVKRSIGMAAVDLAKGNLTPKRRFPTYDDVDALNQVSLISFMLKRRLYLPPFCDDCRCQIAPF